MHAYNEQTHILNVWRIVCEVDMRVRQDIIASPRESEFIAKHLCGIDKPTVLLAAQLVRAEEATDMANGRLKDALDEHRQIIGGLEVGKSARYGTADWASRVIGLRDELDALGVQVLRAISER